MALVLQKNGLSVLPISLYYYKVKRSITQEKHLHK